MLTLTLTLTLTLGSIKAACHDAEVWDDGCNAAMTDVFHAALYGLTIVNLQQHNEMTRPGEKGYIGIQV